MILLLCVTLSLISVTSHCILPHLGLPLFSERTLCLHAWRLQVISVCCMRFMLPSYFWPIWVLDFCDKAVVLFLCIVSSREVYVYQYEI